MTAAISVWSSTSLGFASKNGVTPATPSPVTGSVTDRSEHRRQRDRSMGAGRTRRWGRADDEPAQQPDRRRASPTFARFPWKKFDSPVKTPGITEEMPGRGVGAEVVVEDLHGQQVERQGTSRTPMLLPGKVLSSMSRCGDC